MAARADRVLELVAQRQARRRAFNDRLARLDSPDHELIIRCECGLIGCGAGIKLSEQDFADLHGHYAVLAEHVMPEAERVVAEHGAWVAVETTLDFPVPPTLVTRFSRASRLRP